MKLKFADATIAIIAVLAIMLTILSFLAVRGPAVAVRDFTIREIPSAPSRPPSWPTPHDRGV